MHALLIHTRPQKKDLLVYRYKTETETKWLAKMLVCRGDKQNLVSCWEFQLSQAQGFCFLAARTFPSCFSSNHHDLERFTCLLLGLIVFSLLRDIGKSFGISLNLKRIPNLFKHNEVFTALKILLEEEKKQSPVSETWLLEVLSFWWLQLALWVSMTTILKLGLLLWMLKQMLS